MLGSWYWELKLRTFWFWFPSGISCKNSYMFLFVCSALSDNEYEIGQEPENTWGWGRGQKKGRKRNSGSHRERAGWKDLGGWLTKRKKINGMIDQCWAILDKAGAGGDGCVSEPPDTHAEVCCRTKEKYTKFIQLASFPDLF